jgi:hypothetical protein
MQILVRVVAYLHTKGISCVVPSRLLISIEVQGL